MIEEWYRKPDAEISTLHFYVRKLQRHPAFGSLKRPLNAAKEAVSHSFRMSTQRLRLLPTAVVAGAAKAGTTQLHAHLIKHPRCFSGAEKEVRYFSRFSDRSLAWYRSRFPLRARVERCQGQVIDSSPSYLPTPSALRLMRDVLPAARVIVILRDPTARAFSNYQHQKTRHREARSFAEVVAAELQRNLYSPQLGAALGPAAPPMNDNISGGYYALQLELLLALYPRDQVLILDSADLFDDTAATCQRVFDFLGLEPFNVHPEKVYNRGYYREKIEPQVAELLRDHYRPYDELLTQVVGRPFRWMASGSASRAA
jgi:Sulfotransferase domain